MQALFHERLKQGCPKCDPWTNCSLD